MNKDTVQGSIEQVAGKVKQAFGEATGNQKVANSGAAEQVKGAARETWGHTKDAVSDVATTKRTEADIHAERAKLDAEDKAHNLREKVTSTAQNVKDSVVEKLDDIKRKHAS